ncbi:hypothetical protein [Streptomyces echinatus]|uniref:Uncharacterized protein n=1 Tax=Streptomyces echinatus TaxID=67293 RepID=A0A7W9PU17_9ACTN|nr:hypothetical protein [Streptomyces echinatus]MBB5927919.1 hypothetical protein [Streptomyces echinatus]
MARSAFETVTRSAEQDTGKAVTGEDFCYTDYVRDPDLGPVGVVHIKSAEVSTPDSAEVLGAVAEGVQEFVMSHHRVTWPVYMWVTSMRPRSGNARAGPRIVTW